MQYYYVDYLCIPHSSEDTIQETERMREEYATKERELRDKTQQVDKIYLYKSGT